MNHDVKIVEIIYQNSTKQNKLSDKIRTRIIEKLKDITSSITTIMTAGNTNYLEMDVYFRGLLFPNKNSFKIFSCMNSLYNGIAEDLMTGKLQIPAPQNIVKLTVDEENSFSRLVGLDRFNSPTTNDLKRIDLLLSSSILELKHFQRAGLIKIRKNMVEALIHRNLDFSSKMENSQNLLRNSIEKRRLLEEEEEKQMLEKQRIKRERLKQRSEKLRKEMVLLV